ncbi:hypothetical protein [Marinitenerispora sediminis]|uniref:Uncharacterized protein n=1 Tax=Marinitenerispora sediminis TaxID=1931232 RepID=A0A368T4S6_9ACTN|nr:hypothetical protein [Marinitenerispora sediminis]RCV57793.1 hypothetical protein DEF28_01110 [Marinitenerispora sediminis]RCV58362.1 hypothetical protein DEF24_13610 [Marinitenerispora sediminis]RCV59538.1 hypothetical protein DEF23_07080 [Marinitenerispora sediminis]
MSIPPPPADSPQPVRLSYVRLGETQPELVDRLAGELRAHGRVIIGALTDRDRQRITSGARVAGKRLKRTVRVTDTPNGMVIEFYDLSAPSGDDGAQAPRPPGAHRAPAPDAPAGGIAGESFHRAPDPGAPPPRHATGGDS